MFEKNEQDTQLKGTETMKRFICISLMVVVAVAFSTSVPAGPPVPSTPAAADDILYARPFTLEKGYEFDWSKERPLLTKGTILVLKVNPDLVHARQAAEPVLYVGSRTAERVNIGHRSGRVIAIVPGHIDLSAMPIWFGTPELPERVDGNMIRAEKAQANAAGIEPFEADKVKAALARGGEMLKAADRDSLRPHIAALLLQYSPVEKELIDAFNVPVTR